MFNSYEFTFNGESSLSYGLMLYDIGDRTQDEVGFGNKGSIIETRINNRIQPLHFGVNYHKSPLQFKLVFGSDRELDRYELEDVSLWLTGHQDYKWLTIDQPDLEMVQFKCLITELTPIMHGWSPVAFEATVVCDCPYAYGMEFTNTFQIKGSTDILFRNESSVREFIRPKIQFSSSGCQKISIVNHNDGDREFCIDKLPAGNIEIDIDNKNGIIRELISGYNLYKGFNLNFFRLVHGDNNLTVSGNGTLSISGRFLHNVAG